MPGAKQGQPASERWEQEALARGWDCRWGGVAPECPRWGGSGPTKCLRGGVKEELLGARLQLGLHRQNTDTNYTAVYKRISRRKRPLHDHLWVAPQQGGADWVGPGGLARRETSGQGAEVRAGGAGQGRPAHPCPGGIGSRTAGR